METRRRLRPCWGAAAPVARPLEPVAWGGLLHRERRHGLPLVAAGIEAPSDDKQVDTDHSPGHLRGRHGAWCRLAGADTWPSSDSASPPTVAPPATRRPKPRPAPTGSTTTATGWSTAKTPTAPRHRASEEATPAAAWHRNGQHRSAGKRRRRPPKDGVRRRRTPNRPGGGSRNRPSAIPAGAAATAAASARRAPPPASSRRRRANGGSVRHRRHPDGRQPDDHDRALRPNSARSPNFLIDSFEIPPFLLPIYQACGTEYGIPWEVLASINKIETDFGTNMGASSAGAWAGCSSSPRAGKLSASTPTETDQGPLQPRRRDLRRRPLPQAQRRHHRPLQAIFSYNHADWYVEEVLALARAYGKLHRSGRLADRAHRGRPLPGRRRRPLRRRLFAREALKQLGSGRRRATGTRRNDLLLADPARHQHLPNQGAPVVAVNDGTIKAVGDSPARQVHRARGRLRQPLHLCRAGRIVRSGGGILTSNGPRSRWSTPRTCGPGCYALPHRATGSPRKATLK